MSCCGHLPAARVLFFVCWSGRRNHHRTKGTRTVQTEHQPTHARAGDQTIMNIAGHVSRAMLSRYSHVRMEAKRRAVDEIAARQCAADKKRKPEVERLQPLTTMATEPGSMGSCTNRRCLAS